ncbi:MAG: malto-oligosyltrehalose trehalohydrolase [Microbacteriaceae bacterium]|nr:malto-oligosyltrehalose trehalohydrolase [Microbacteriaceae bacterium]
MRDSRFDVWAPRAQRMRLLVDGREYPMSRSDESWWRPVGLPLLDPRAPLGEHDYGYLIDDDPDPRPDPRSRRQPAGVHGLSRTFDAGAFEWTDAAWTGRQLAGGVVYELHIGTFTPDGTLDAAIDRLDHLVDLGVDFVELMPVNAFNGDHGWGYDGVYWYAVHEPYGGPFAYQRFVDACHARGLGVIQDVVYNHLGPSGNYLGMFGPYLAPQHTTAWGDGVNLDGFDSDQVRRYIIDNVLMWVRDFHVDGLRLDAVHALVDTRAKHILEEISDEADAISAFLGRPISLIAESDLNAPRMIATRDAGGYALTAQWSDDFHHAAHVCLTGEDDGYYEDFAEQGGGFGALEKVLTKGFYHDGSLSTFRRRHHGRPLSPTTRAWRLVASTQNHDQIGNRARGDRLSETLSPDQLAVGATLLLCAPFTPMLFMGEEWGSATPFQFFSSHPEPELAEATSRGRIEEFARMGWDRSEVPNPQDPETFRRSKLEWQDLDFPEHQRLLGVYRELLRLRRTHPELASPWLRDVTVTADAEARTFSFWRGDLQVVLNFAAEERQVELDVDVRYTKYRELPKLLFATREGVSVRMREGEGREAVDIATMPAHSAAVFGPEPQPAPEP